MVQARSAIHIKYKYRKNQQFTISFNIAPYQRYNHYFKQILFIIYKYIKILYRLFFETQGRKYGRNLSWSCYIFHFSVTKNILDWYSQCTLWITALLLKLFNTFIIIIRNYFRNLIIINSYISPILSNKFKINVYLNIIFYSISFFMHALNKVIN